MIEIQDITIGYGGSEPLIERQSCSLPVGTLTALTGRNGSGKSTLLRAVSGMERPTAGRVLIGPERLDAATVSPARLASLVSLVTTGRVNSRHLLCRQVVELGRAPHTGLFGRLHDSDRQAVDRALDLVGIAHLAQRDVSGISDGEYQRLMLARALAQDTPVILLDEPTGFLDVPNRRAVTQLLASLAHDAGKCILFSTHELDAAMASADFILHIADRRLMLLSPEQMRSYAPFASMAAF